VLTALNVIVHSCFPPVHNASCARSVQHLASVWVLYAVVHDMGNCYANFKMASSHVLMMEIWDSVQGFAISASICPSLLGLPDDQQAAAKPCALHLPQTVRSRFEYTCLVSPRKSFSYIAGLHDLALFWEYLHLIGLMSWYADDASGT
jgi:hypothetical protein